MGMVYESPGKYKGRGSICYACHAHTQNWKTIVAAINVYMNIRMVFVWSFALEEFVPPIQPFVEPLFSPLLPVPTVHKKYSVTECHSR